MKIAVNARFLIPNKLEGIGWFTYEITRRLVQEHPEHEFLFLFDRPYDAQFIFGDNVQAEVVFPPARHATLWYWWFEWSLPRLLKKHKVDVFFSPDSFLSLRSSVKTLMVVHDIAYEYFPKQVPFHGRVFYKHFFPKYVKRAEKIIAVSEYTKRDIQQHYGIPASKIDVACNGCRSAFQVLEEDTKLQIRKQYADGQDYFFYLGAVHPRKNVHRLIEAFDCFKAKTNAPFKLLIGGRFAWQTGIVHTAFQNAKHKSDIIFLGYVADDVLPQLMGAATALTYLSLFEGFGIPLLEAMHCEVPIIGSNVTSIPEVVGKAGLLVPPNDIEAISMAMEEVYKDAALREKLIAAGNIQRSKFSWEIATDLVYRNLSALCEGDKK